MLVGERYDEAEKVLVQAVSELDQQSGAEGKGDVDTLINLLVCYQHQGKGMDVMEPVLKQLKEGWKNHPFVKVLLIEKLLSILLRHKIEILFFARCDWK